MPARVEEGCLTVHQKKRFGRDTFQESMKIAHRMDNNKINWAKFRYMVFDTPTSKGNYAERYNHMRMLFSLSLSLSLSPIYLFLCTGEALQGKTFKYLTVAEYEVCKDTGHLDKMFQDLIMQGGEGVILRDPTSPYEPGRSSGFLKHKVGINFPPPFP